MKLKKIVVILLSVIFIIPQNIPVSASAQGLPGTGQDSSINMSITPCWVNVNSITLDLSFSSGQAHCYGRILAARGTTAINATFTLERKCSYGWTVANTWSRSSVTDSLTFYTTNVAYERFEYRFSVTATVIRNGVYEVVSSSVEATY